VGSIGVSLFLVGVGITIVGNWATAHPPAWLEFLLARHYGAIWVVLGVLAATGTLLTLRAHEQPDTAAEASSTSEQPEQTNAAVSLEAANGFGVPQRKLDSPVDGTPRSESAPSLAASTQPRPPATTKTGWWDYTPAGELNPSFKYPPTDERHYKQAEYERRYKAKQALYDRNKG
jgi:hypothetical protein